MRPPVSGKVWVFWLSLVGAVSANAQVDLPTPEDHYENFDAQTLLIQLAVKVPEENRERAMELFKQARDGGSVTLSVEETTKLLESANWDAWRPELLRLFLHRSNVLEVVPEDARTWVPLVHDSLLFFLHHMSEERLVDRLVAQANLGTKAERGERVLAFIANTPSLQKLAQILARNPAIDEDFRAALQTVENGLATAQYSEIMRQIDEEMSADTQADYALEFSDRLLAEASVGAVIRASFRRPGSTETEQAACKVLKPYAVAALKEDLQIIDDLLVYLEANADFYDLGSTPLVDIFKELREALSREVRVEDERENLRRAAEYYKYDSKVIVPELYPFSSENITCMEFIQGVKVTDAFPERHGDRAALAKRLSDAMTYDVLFAEQDVALFHGDPHAGNVFHVEGRASDPYRIALIDWGLAAEFSREEREKMIQLMLGLSLGHAKRLANNVDVLVDWEPAGDDDRREMKARIQKMLDEDREGGMFGRLDKLIASLARDGFSVKFNTTMFIKSQLTISGILMELDPDFQQDEHVMGRVSGQVTRELPKRLVRTIWFPAWNSHDYPSMMSNEDVKDVQFQKIGRFFKAVGRGIWKGVTFQWLF